MIRSGIVCKSCGTLFSGGPRALYCPDCRKERAKEQRQKRSMHGTARPLGSMDYCIRCGKQYIVKSGLQKYCSECAPIAIREIDCAQGLEYYHANKAVINPARNALRRKIKKCIICGKEFSDGTCRKTCGPECDRERRQKWQREYDRKRRKGQLNNP